MKRYISRLSRGFLFPIIFFCLIFTYWEASGQTVIFSRNINPPMAPSKHLTIDVSTHRLDIIKDISQSAYNDPDSDARNKQGFKMETVFIFEENSDKTLFQLYSSENPVSSDNFLPDQNVLELRCRNGTFVIRMKAMDAPDDKWMEWTLWDEGFIQLPHRKPVALTFVMDNQHIKVMNKTENRTELYYYGLSASSLESYIYENDYLYLIIGAKGHPSAAITHAAMFYDIGSEAKADPAEL